MASSTFSLRVSSAAAVTAAMLFAATFAAVGLAAPDAGGKARGDYNFYGHSAHHAFSSAQANVGTYQRYLNETHGVPLPPATPATAAEPAALAAPAAQVTELGAVDPEIARGASDAIAADIERIQRHVNRMRAQAKTSGDSAALAKLADVDKQLGIARRRHAAHHGHHAEDAIAPATAMSLAQRVNDALRAAHAEHDEVVARLGKPAQP
jgi:hypothetical protein